MIVNTPVQGIVAKTERLSLKIVVSDSEIAYAIYDELHLLFKRSYRSEGSESILSILKKLEIEDNYWNALYRNVSVAYDSGHFESFPSSRKIDLKQIENLRKNYKVLGNQILGIDRNALVGNLIAYPYSSSLIELKAKSRLQHMSSCLLRFLSIYAPRGPFVLCHKRDSQLTMILHDGNSMWKVYSLWLIKPEELSYFFKSALSQLNEGKIFLSGYWSEKESEYINRTFSDQLADFMLGYTSLTAEEFPFMALNVCG